MNDDQRARLSLATRLAQTHQSPSVIFWTADDWATGHVVQATRLTPERVKIAVRSVGEAGFIPVSSRS